MYKSSYDFSTILTYFSAFVNIIYCLHFQFAVI